MDTQATIDAIRLLQGGLVNRQFIGRESVTPVGQRILDSAIYHLERDLYDYLTGRNR